MAHSALSQAKRTASDYKNLRSIPAGLGMVFFLVSAYVYGAFGDSLEIAWISYQVTAFGAGVASLVILVLAFMSSETRNWKDYADWEKLLIGAALGLPIITGYWDPMYDVVFTYDPWTPVVAFLLSIAGYGTAIR